MYDTKDEKNPKTRAKKDTKKWCKGIEGRAHDLYIEKDQYNYGRRYYSALARVRCSKCGKVFDWGNVFKFFAAAVMDSNSTAILLKLKAATVNELEEAVYDFCKKYYNFDKTLHQRNL